MTAQPTSAVEESSVASNGNGNGRFWNGIVNIATSGVLLAVFVIWWSVANPNPRLDKIEADMKTYLSLREHEEFQSRANQIIAGIEKRLDDNRAAHVSQEERFAHLSEVFVTRNEALIQTQKDDKLFDITQARIDRLYGILDDLSKRISSTRESILLKDQSRLPQK